MTFETLTKEQFEAYIFASQKIVRDNKIKTHKVKKVTTNAVKSVKSVSVIDDETISCDNKDKVVMRIFNKRINEEISIFIPKYYIFDITYFLKENYLITRDSNNKINIYITPLIRTLISDFRSYVKKDETLARTLKERVISEALRLIRKSVEKSKVVIINNKEYIKILADFKKTDKENHYAILNATDTTRNI
jgi:predicted nucleic-acid-binding protein